MPDSTPVPFGESRIVFIRGHKVLLDTDLALLSEVETRRYSPYAFIEQGVAKKRFGFPTSKSRAVVLE